MSLSDKEQYINELKQLLLTKDAQSHVINEETTIEEGYYEWEIDNFEDFIDNADDTESPEFTLCNHKWNILIYSYFGSFILYLQNKDIQSDKEFIWTKIAFSVRNYKDTSKYKAYPSSLYCFSNTNYDYYSGYKNEIFEQEYQDSIRPLIEDDKIVLGVYLRVCKGNNRDQYISKIKNSIKNEDDYFEVKSENYYEWAIENWKKIENSSDLSPNFKIGDHEWKVSIYPNENGFVKFELNNFNSYRLKSNEYFYIHYGIVLRNSFDLSCFSSTSSSKLVRISKREDKINVDDFLKTDDLYTINKETNRSLIEDNKVVIGVYIRVFDKEQNINNQLTSSLKSLISREEDNFKIKDENYFEWRVDNWMDLKNTWEYSPLFNIGDHEW